MAADAFFGLSDKDVFSCSSETLCKELDDSCVNRSLSPPNVAAPASVPRPISRVEAEDDELDDGSSATEVTADSPCLESNSNYAGRKRKSADDDDPITKLAPFIKQQIEDALNNTLLPLVSVLRSREEDEQKHRENMLVLEEQKLALKREKLRFKRRRASLQLQSDPRASSLASSGHRKHGRGLRAKTSAR